MLGEEKLKLNLNLAYKINILYLKLMTSTSVLSSLTDVPVSSIKRYLNMLKLRTDDYLKLLPELGNREHLLEIQRQVDELKELNIIENKWSKTDSPLNSFKVEIDEIKELYKKIKPVSDQELIITINNLKINNLSIRKIAEATGVSLGRIHKLLNQKTDRVK